MWFIVAVIFDRLRFLFLIKTFAIAISELYRNSSYSAISLIFTLYGVAVAADYANRRGENVLSSPEVKEVMAVFFREVLNSDPVRKAPSFKFVGLYTVVIV